MKYLSFLILSLALFLSTNAQTIKIACIGDSTTDGFGLANPSLDAWPILLQNMLETKPIFKEQAQAYNFGASGKTLQKNGNDSYWKERRFETVKNLAPDILILTLGTNDVKEINWKDPENFRKDLNEMLDIFVEKNPKVKIYLGTNVWVRKDAIGITRERIENGSIPIIKDVAKKRGLKIIDFNTLTKDHPDWYCDDIHPNELGALKMAELVYQTLSGGKTAPEVEKFRGTKSGFEGFEKYDFQFRYRNSSLIIPKTPTKDNKWVWVTSSFENAKILHPKYKELLEKGYYILHTDLDSWLANPNAIRWGNEVLKYYLNFLNFSPKVEMIGIKVGAAYVLNFAAANPEKIEDMLFVDPIFDIYKWADENERNMKQFLQEWHLNSETKESVKNLAEDNIKKVLEAGTSYQIIFTENISEEVKTDSQKFFLKKLPTKR